MLINWETLPTLLCLWMGVLIAVQYRKILTQKNIMLGIVYFIILFASGLPWLISYGAALRAFASTILLCLIWLNSGAISDKKTKTLLKLPLLGALLSYSFAFNFRALNSIELVVAVVAFIIFYKDKEVQGVRFRHFIKTTILGTIYLMIKLSLTHQGFQFLAMGFKLAALYYLYCLVSSYAAQAWFKKHSS